MNRAANRSHGKPVLLLGATGMVGHRVATGLRARGVAVRAFVRDPKSARAKALAAAGCEIARGDLRQRWTIWQAIEGCEAVISCAHICHADALVQACRVHNVARLIVFSSAWKKSRFQSAAMRGWWQAEAAVRECGLAWTILRATTIYDGKEDRTVARVARWVRRLPVVPLPGGGQCRVAPLHADDAAEAAISAFANPRAAVGREFLLAGGEQLTYAGMVRRIATAQRRRVWILPVPVPLVLLGVRLTGSLARRAGVDLLAVRRFTEDRAFDSGGAAALLGRRPSDFAPPRREP